MSAPARRSWPTWRRPARRSARGGDLPAPALRRVAAAARRLRLGRLAVGDIAPRARDDVRRRPTSIRTRPDRSNGHELRPLPRRSRADDCRSRAHGGPRFDRIAPLEDAIGELSGWYAFSDAFKRDQERRAADTGWLGLVPSAPATLDRPAQECRPERSCPCGSGKKFKKCCPAKVSSRSNRRLKGTLRAS